VKRRVRIIYDGREFTIPDVGSAEVRRRIDAALTGDDHWLEVVSGLGRGTHAFLRVTAGAPIALLDESTEIEGEGSGPAPEHDPLE
jgi:hypothetical protein